MRNFFLKLFSSSVSIPAFAWVMSSLAFAIYAFWHRDIIQATAFGQHLPVDTSIWTVALMVGDITVLAGMILRLRKVPLIRGGAMLSFLCWTFGNLSLLESPGTLKDKLFSIFLLTGYYWIMYVYLFIAAGLGLFRRND